MSGINGGPIQQPANWRYSITPGAVSLASYPGNVQFDGIVFDDISMFSDRATVQAASVPSVVQSFQTSGFAAPGDGGGAQYVRAGGSGPGRVQSADGQWWAPVFTYNPSVDAFGAVGNGVANDTAAISASELFGGRKFVPAGIYNTTLASNAFQGPFLGPGQLQDNLGNRRAPMFAAIGVPPASFGNADSIETLYNGDLSKTQIVIEHRITGPNTLGLPASGYLNRPEAYPFVGGLYIGPDAGYQASPSTDLSRTNGCFQFVNVYHFGRGDGSILTGNLFVAGNNNATDALAFPAGGVVFGQVTAGADDVNCNPIEVNALDAGFNASLQSIIGNVYRNNSSTAKGRYVYGARMQSQGTQAGDAAFSAQGSWKVGLDLTPLATTAARGAIAMREADRIYLSAVAATGRYVTNYGADWIEKSAGGFLNFVLANSSRLQIGETVNCQVPTRLPVYTAANLPPGLARMECYCSDANSTTRGATVVGGGSNLVKCWFNGTNWIIA